MSKFVIVLVIGIITSCSTNNSAKISKVKVSDNKFSFKVIKYRDTIRHKFLIKNIGQNPLIINAVGSSCGCVITRFSRKPTLKNKFAEVDVTFTPSINQTGKVRKTILVKCNTEDVYIPLYIEGFVLGDTSLKIKKGKLY